MLSSPQDSSSLSLNFIAQLPVDLF